jgi:hypothetical protein
MPILSFIPFASPRAAHVIVPSEFSMAKNFILNSDRSNNTEAHENKN